LYCRNGVATWHGDHSPQKVSDASIVALGLHTIEIELNTDNLVINFTRFYKIALCTKRKKDESERKQKESK